MNISYFFKLPVTRHLINPLASYSQVRTELKHSFCHCFLAMQTLKNAKSSNDVKQQ